MDILAVKHGVAKAVWQPRNAEEAKLIVNFREDHNVVRAKGVEYFIEVGKYTRNQWWVLEKVEWWEWVIETIPEEQKEENKTDEQRAEEAKLVINFGEEKEEVMSKGVQRFIDMKKYLRNQWGVLVKNEWETLENEENATETSQSDVKDKEIVDFNELSLEELQVVYKEVTGKDLAPAYKNKREWILSKLA